MSSRMVGFGSGPIWWETVQKYCNEKELDDEQTEAMHHHIKAMDLVYLKHVSKKNS